MTREENSIVGARALATKESSCQIILQKFVNIPYLSTSDGNGFSEQAKSLLLEYEQINSPLQAASNNNIGAEPIRNLFDLMNAMSELMKKTFSIEDLKIKMGKNKKIGAIWRNIKFIKGAGDFGYNNHGIYISEAEKLLIKIIGGSATSTLREVYWAIQAYKVGGPVLVSVSHTKTGEIFLVMEKLFPGQKTISYKELVAKSFNSDHFLVKIGNSKFIEALKDEISEKFQAVLENSILPFDPDFLINSEGQVRWLDVGDWKQANSRSDTLVLLDGISRRLNKRIGGDFSEQLMARLFERLENAAIISSAEIKELHDLSLKCPCTLSGIGFRF